MISIHFTIHSDIKDIKITVYIYTLSVTGRFMTQSIKKYTKIGKKPKINLKAVCHVITMST